MKSQLSGRKRIADGPLLRQIKKLPLAAALTAPVVMCVDPSPFGPLCGVPDDLWVRPLQDVLSPSFELVAVRGVDYFIVSPFICKIHDIFLSLPGNYDNRLKTTGSRLSDNLPLAAVNRYKLSILSGKKSSGSYFYKHESISLKSNKNSLVFTCKHATM